MKHYNYKDLPCYDCIVKMMCSKPCDKIVSFLESSLRGSTLPTITCHYIASLLLNGRLILYPEETSLGTKYYWELTWWSERR